MVERVAHETDPMAVGTTPAVPRDQQLAEAMARDVREELEEADKRTALAAVELIMAMSKRAHRYRRYNREFDPASMSEAAERYLRRELRDVSTVQAANLVKQFIVSAPRDIETDYADCLAEIFRRM